MPPRIPRAPRPVLLRISQPTTSSSSTTRCLYASLATTPGPSHAQITQSAPPISHYPPTQPPSHKPPELRKSQLHRQYTSILRSTPLILLFQHNNLRAAEWLAIRRELVHALQKVDSQFLADGKPENQHAADIKLQIVQTGILKPAMRVVEFYNPPFDGEPPIQHPTDPRTASSAAVVDAKPFADDPAHTHFLSRQAHDATYRKKLSNGMENLIVGPIALLTFPSVTPQHLKAALSILAPNKQFPAPKRKERPSYHELTTQNGLQKLLLLAARVEGKVFDQEGTRWIGGIEGGLDGLRAQLVGMLQGFGAQITNVLEGAGRSLYLTMEGRKGQLEEESKPKEAEKKPEGEGEAKPADSS